MGAPLDFLFRIFRASRERGRFRAGQLAAAGDAAARRDWPVALDGAVWVPSNAVLAERAGEHGGSRRQRGGSTAVCPETRPRFGGPFTACRRPSVRWAVAAAARRACTGPAATGTRLLTGNRSCTDTTAGQGGEWTRVIDLIAVRGACGRRPVSSRRAEAEGTQPGTAHAGSRNAAQPARLPRTHGTLPAWRLPAIPIPAGP
jgi:hypothetical protein